MEPNNEKLIDYLDKNLSPDQAREMENLLQEDRSLESELAYLKLTVDTVRQEAIRKQVSAIRLSYEQNRSFAADVPKAKTRTIYRASIRLAAILLLILGATGIIKYISVKPATLYAEQFAGYELNNMRSGATSNAQEEAYRNKDWSGVISFYQAEPVHFNKSSFLAGIAELQENQYTRAAQQFNEVLKNPDESFHEDAEYYLALACLMTGENTRAAELLAKIKSDPNHRYAPLADRISTINLKIIKLKK